MSNLIVKNTTFSSITVSGYNVYSVDSSITEIVIVKDQLDNRFNSFKFTYNVTDYYYVIDGIQTQWVDDLSSIGYSEVQPAPALPTVITTNDSGHRFKFNSYGSDYTFSATGTTSVYKDTSGTTKPDWDSTKVYGVIKYWDYDGTQIGRQGITPIEAPSWGDAGKIYMRNDSGEALTVAKIRVATCDNLSATVAIVYDAQNTTYNAFKYTTDNIDYYYVLDETQTDWTDDLSSIGYSLTPAVVLPTVSVTGDYDTNNWLYARIDGTNTYVSSGSDVLVGETDSHSHIISELYDDSKSYAVIRWGTYQSQQGSGRTEYSIVKGSDGYIHAKNVTSEALYLYALRCAVCSSNQATVIPVCDSQNNFYNAFKYTTNNTDYYYVLDEIQTDWVTDLSSIGYSRSIEVWFYLDRASASKTFDADDYWGTFIIDDTDRQILSSYGVTIYRNSFAQNEYQVDKSSINNFSFEPLGLYSGVRTGDLGANMSNFYCGTYTGGIYSSVVIKSINAYSTSSKTWKCRITKL